MNFSHNPVLLETAIDNLNIIENGVYVDCTFGRGGHSKIILDKIGENGKLIAIDKDKDAEDYAKRILVMIVDLFLKKIILVK